MSPKKRLSLSELNNTVDNASPGDDMIYNHRMRRKYSRNFLRNQKDYITDHLGVTHTTNQLRELHKRERYNFKNWIDRVIRSVEYGKKVAVLKEEEMYKDNIHQMEAREQVCIKSLSDVFGEEYAKQMRDDYWKRVEHRQNKKLTS